MEIEKIEIVKEGIYYTLYINDVYCGCAGLKDFLYDMKDYLKAFENGEFE